MIFRINGRIENSAQAADRRIEEFPVQNGLCSRENMEQVAKVLKDVDRDYFSVAIIGVQNSGKSTLLNHVFGTNFDVLKQMAGSRTTRGILTSVDKTENIIILDVEGNDAMDRAEDQVIHLPRRTTRRWWPPTHLSPPTSSS